MATQPHPGKQQIRIIGGQWRGRRLPVANVPGLRPSGDRNRETLFNWIQPLLPGADCLDLFAGSGALGLEAASRGANHVLLVEQARPAVIKLQDAVCLLAAEELVSVWHGDAMRYLHGPAKAFDIVFLDPPFASSLLQDACARLERGGWLSPNARIYLETDRSNGIPPLPPTWTILRQKTAGHVCFALAARNGSSHAPT